MKLNLISWNIRHLRMDKVKKYIDHILLQVDSGHVMFFYENKSKNDTGKEFVDAIGDPLTKSASAGSMRLEWGGLRYSVGTNENVWINYSKSCTIGDKSKIFTQGSPFTITVRAEHSHDGILQTEGMNALKNSRNVTIMSKISMLETEFRTPAIVHIIIDKPDGKSKTISSGVLACARSRDRYAAVAKSSLSNLAS